MKIFQMNDCDWYMAHTLEEAIAAALKDYGGDHEMLDEPRELTEAEMDNLKFRLDSPECEACGAKLDEAVGIEVGNWRQSGAMGWEHSHDYPLGHVTARTKITFREELARNIKAGIGPQLFASTEA